MFFKENLYNSVLFVNLSKWISLQTNFEQYRFTAFIKHKQQHLNGMEKAKNRKQKKSEH